jgi:phage repressor protein C with HTH and peptisase S24 domain
MFKNKLKILIDLLGLSLKDFSRKTGIPYPTLQDYLAGKIKPGADNLEKISMVFHVNLNWLLTGEGEPFVKKPVDVSGIMKEEKPVEKADMEDFVYVPVVSGRISAGGGLIPDTSIELRLAFRRDWIKRHGDPGNMSLIRVSGDSMEPTLYSGDIVLVDHNRNYIDPQGGIYAIAMDDIIMIKRLQMIYPAMKIRVISDNPRYETFELEPDRVVINGKVIWFGREIER